MQLDEIIWRSATQHGFCNLILSYAKDAKKTKAQPNFGIAVCTNLIVYTLDVFTTYAVTTAIPMLRWHWKKCNTLGCRIGT